MYQSVTRSFFVLMLLAVIASSAMAGINDGLVAHFKLDETSGTFAADSSGNGNDGTLIGTALTWVQGRDDGALMISPPATGDVADRLEFPTTGMSVTAGTVCVWVNLADPQPASSGRYIFGHTTQPQFNSRIQLYMQDGTNVSRRLDFGLGSSHTTRTDIVELPMNEWLHVAFTWNNGAYAIYLDGAEIAAGSYSGLTALHPVANFGNDGSNAPYEAFGGMLDEARVYNRALTAGEVKTIASMQPAGKFMAKEPSPADKAQDVRTDVALAWTASEFAATHDVYLGTAFADVNDASRADPKGILASQGQTATTYDLASPLAYGQTYYWRVDEVNAAPDNTIFQGAVWSFTTEPYAYPLTNVTATASSSQPNMGPENTVNGSGLNENDEHAVELTQMWMSAGTQPNWIQYEFDDVYKIHQLLVWNSNQQIETFVGFGARNVAIEYSTDGAAWTPLADVPEFAKATGAPTYTANTTVDFGGVAAKYVKLTIENNWGGVTAQTGLSEVRFLYVPVKAWQPTPADAATDAGIDSPLTWRAGRQAASHQVFFGTDSQAVADGTATAQTVTDDSFDPGALTLGTLYYWKVVEVNEAATPTAWEGDVWSFTTTEYLPVDDMESYNDEDNRIYEAWVDGVTTGASGSIVGYMQAPFAERTIVHGGKQSMPFEYNNVNTPFYSEAEQEFAPAQNWTVSGADTLSLWVQGRAASFAEEAGTITMSAAGTDIWGTADDFRFAYKTLSGDGSILVKVESLVNTNAWAKAGVMIRQDLTDSSKFAYLIQSFSSGVSLGWRPTPAATCGSATQANVTAPQWVKLTRKGDVFTAQYSADGNAWTDLKNADGTVASTTVAMTNPVYVGLCVTSHNVSATTTAVMSGAATTGNVTGSWQALAIGNDPQTANAPADLYVTVQDSAGKTATAVNPTAVTSGQWTQWQIPLSSLTGVNLNAVKKMFIGVDNRTSPIKGAGMLFLDDIGFGHPAQ